MTSLCRPSNTKLNEKATGSSGDFFAVAKEF